jgi:hypothetical protein
MSYTNLGNARATVGGDRPRPGPARYR